MIFNQLIVGTIIIISPIFISAIMIGGWIWFSATLQKYLSRFSIFFQAIFSLVFTTIWIVFIVTISIWLWAFDLMLLNIFPSLEPSLYFVMVAFTSLGLGDIILPQSWRLLSGFISSNGLILFGLRTAFLFEYMQTMRKYHMRETKK